MQTYPSGVIDLYNDDILTVMDYVKKNCTKCTKDLVFGWSMTWALQQGVPHYQMYYHGHNQHAASRIFTHYEIPNGSCIVVKPGIEYRPEGWGADLTKATPAVKRPGVVKAQITEVTDQWWDAFEYRAFTVQRAYASIAPCGPHGAIGRIARSAGVLANGQ